MFSTESISLWSSTQAVGGNIYCCSAVSFREWLHSKVYRGIIIIVRDVSWVSLSAHLLLFLLSSRPLSVLLFTLFSYSLVFFLTIFPVKLNTLLNMTDCFFNYFGVTWQHVLILMGEIYCMFCCLLLEAVLAATWLRLQVKKNKTKLTSRGTTSGRNREQSLAHAFCEIIFNLFWFIMILTSFIPFFNMFKCNDFSNVVWCNR